MSVVLCTFNRAPLLAGALDALLHQSPGTPPHEIIVVDNNSTDETRDVVATFLGSGTVRYEFEKEQGVSAARNHGIARSSAPLIAFTDDDVRVDPTWVRTIADTFARHREVDMVGGKVEPDWEVHPPPWLSDAGLAPLAVADYGDEPFFVTPTRPVCLLAANVCVRRAAFDRIGLFSKVLQRVADGIGSTEDQELEMRLLRAGRAVLYEPRMLVRAQVPRERLSKRYHRAWHEGHGRFYALMRDPLFESSRRGAVLGVPAHVFRSVVEEGAAWLRATMLLQRSAAFAHELRLRFLMAFARQRMFPRT